jgi:hypothetical protein
MDHPIFWQKSRPLHLSFISYKRSLSFSTHKGVVPKFTVSLTDFLLCGSPFDSVFSKTSLNYLLQAFKNPVVTFPLAFWSSLPLGAHAWTHLSPLTLSQPPTDVFPWRFMSNIILPHFPFLPWFSCTWLIGALMTWTEPRVYSDFPTADEAQPLMNA